jgi:hypothetical protein
LKPESTRATGPVISGIVHLVGGLDRATAEAITVSTWDTEERARYSDDALGDIPARVQALGTQLESTRIFEVATPPERACRTGA